MEKRIFEACENCIFQPPLGYTRDCLNYSNIEDCPNNFLYSEDDEALDTYLKGGE